MKQNKISKKFEDLKYASINSLIYYNYYHKKIDENLVYVECKNGKDFSGNIFRIVEELSKDVYSNFKIVVYAKKNVHPKIKELKKNYKLDIDKIVSSRTTGTRIMEKAKYIITDASLFHKFVKRPSQVVINTWQGTFLKTIGKDNSLEQYKVSSTQQVLFSCDYLLTSNDFTRVTLLSAYMMEKVYPGKILYCGNPKNTFFFDDKNIKDELGLGDYEIFAYMPNFRNLALFRDKKDRKSVFENILKELDDSLNDNQVLLFKFHIGNSSIDIDFSKFKHIKTFPEGYEDYDVLNVADVLITDYSRVIFDFANTKRKIILFNHDEKKYLKYHGLYIPLSDLPFPKVDNISDLIAELNSAKGYDESEFIKNYCPFENADAARDFCSHIFNQKNILKEEKIDNPNKNTIIFAGALMKNGMTTSMVNLLDVVDTKDHDYFISYRAWSKRIKRYFPEVKEMIPENIELMPLRTAINPTLREYFSLNRFIKRKEGNGKYPKELKNLFDRELARSFSDFKFDNYIHFTSYGIEEILMFSQSKSNSIIWAHGNMLQVIDDGEGNLPVLNQAYNAYDKVAVVSEETKSNISEISGKDDNVHVVPNINTYEKTIENSKLGIEFDDDTIMMCSNPYGIKGVLESPAKKFITVGRFSEEKNHHLLLKAFDEFCEDYPDTQLIIIGGYGPLYFRTRRFAEKLNHSKNVTIIRSVSNPMPILKECDLFILPSTREGWPMTVMEANTLGVPVITSRIGGTDWIEKYGAYRFDNTFDGILKAFHDYMKGNVKTDIDIDYEKFNDDILNEFYDLIDK